MEGKQFVIGMIKQVFDIKGTKPELYASELQAFSKRRPDVLFDCTFELFTDFQRRQKITDDKPHKCGNTCDPESGFESSFHRVTSSSHRQPELLEVADLRPILCEKLDSKKKVPTATPRRLAGETAPFIEKHQVPATMGLC